MNQKPRKPRWDDDVPFLFKSRRRQAEIGGKWLAIGIAVIVGLGVMRLMVEGLAVLVGSR